MKQMLQAYVLPEKIITAKMMLYENTTAMVRSPNNDVVAGVLQEDTLAPYMFINKVGDLSRGWPEGSFQ